MPENYPYAPGMPAKLKTQIAKPVAIRRDDARLLWLRSSQPEFRNAR
jgi:hypothetical protein